MAAVATYVFVDIETTGLPEEENNKTRIIELSMIAVRRQHLLDTKLNSLPRVIKKMTLCFNPGRPISEISTKLTNLDNFMLEYETPFNINVYNTIISFLNLFTKPVCLVAHNGYNFDFPIIQSEMAKLKVSLSDDILCADTFYAFYDILKEKHSSPSSADLQAEVEQLQEQHIGDFTEQRDVSEATSSPDMTDQITYIDLTDDDPVVCNVNLKLINETTPSRRTRTNNVHAPEKQTEVKLHPTNSRKRLFSDEMSANVIQPVANLPSEDETVGQSNKLTSNNSRKSFDVPPIQERGKYPWGEKSNRPKDSYKLVAIYERLTKNVVIDAHQAECDCIMMLHCASVLGKEFVAWVDENNSLFSDIKPMTCGVPVGK